jgi:hypothetical protein
MVFYDKYVVIRIEKAHFVLTENEWLKGIKRGKSYARHKTQKAREE